MHILITGAGGFFGSLLAERVLNNAAFAHARVTLFDMSIEPNSFPNARIINGSLSDESVLRDAFADGVDTVYHLASVPGGTAERDHPLESSVNLYGTLKLIYKSATQTTPARFVFASSIAVRNGRCLIYAADHWH
jgi:nucleoside-diphosphate-sugar epimerase